MGLESEWKLLEQIIRINIQAGEIKEEITPLIKEVEEMEHIHTRFEQIYGSKFGINRRELKNNKIKDRYQLLRMEELIRAEDSQPQKMNFLGIGGMKKDEYYTFTDKINLVVSSLKELIDGRNRDLEEQIELVKGDLKNYEDNYHDLMNEYQVSVAGESRISDNSVDVKLCIGTLSYRMPVSQSIRDIFEEEQWDIIAEGKITLLLLQHMEQPQPLFILFENDKDRKETYCFVRNMMRQIMSKVPLYQYEFCYLDGMNNGSGLREMLDLQNVQDAYADSMAPQLNSSGFQMLRVERDSDGIHRELVELEKYMAQVTDLLQGTTSFNVYNQDNEEKIPYKIVILEGIGMNQESNLIKKLVVNGSKCGIFVILLQDKKDLLIENQYEKRKCDRLILAENMAKIDLSDENTIISIKVNDKDNREYPFSLFAADNDYSSFVHTFVEEKNNIKPGDNSFATWFPENYKYGQYTSTIETTDGNLEGKIQIPFAVDRRGRLTSIELGSADYAHGLISGATGSGKSTMLHMLINSVVMNYRPDDVEIWLADYKKVEMSVYINERPPHIKFIGIERNEEFTFSLLDLIMAEHSRRMKLFVKENVRNIDLYKKKHGMGSIPRILLIIDEFHLMSQQVHENAVYSRKLENLLAEGRGVGIVCLFADQSISKGLNGLTQKGKDQMRMRISMANNKEEMAITLDTNKVSDADAALKKGEVRVKRMRQQRNSDGTIDRVACLELEKVIYISDEHRRSIARKAIELYGEGREPLILDGNKIAEYDETLIEAYEQSIEEERDVCYLHLGKPSNFEKCFAVSLFRNYGENIACVLGKNNIARRILLSTIKSFMRDTDREIYILADESDSSFFMVKKELKTLSSINKGLHISSEYSDICQVILRLYSEMLNRRRNQKKNNILVFWFGLESILEEFSHYNKYQSKKEINIEKRDIVFDSIQVRLDEKFASMDMFNDSFFKKEQEEDADEEEYLYNLTDQIIELIGEGSKRGIYQFVFYSSVLSAKKAKVIKMDNFKYKISGLLSKDDSYDFFGNAKFMDSFDDGEDGPGDTLVCYDGIKARFFLPYLMENE